MFILNNVTAVCLAATVVGLTVGDVAQIKPGVTICVASNSTEPQCLGDPLPAILKDSHPSNRHREFDYRGDGSVAPYRAR